MLTFIYLVIPRRFLKIQCLGHPNQYKSGSEYIDIRKDAFVVTASFAPSQGFSIYSVTYSDL